MAPLSIPGQISRIPSLFPLLPSFLLSFIRSLYYFHPLISRQLVFFRTFFRALFDYGWDLLRGQFPRGDDINWHEDNEDGHVFFLFCLLAMHIHFRSYCIIASKPLAQTCSPFSFHLHLSTRLLFRQLSYFDDTLFQPFQSALISYLPVELCCLSLSQF